MTNIPISYDSENERPVPSIFHDTFDAVVKAFQHKNANDKLAQMQNVFFDDNAIRISMSQVKDYPASEVSIGGETWKSSFCYWEETYWSILIDLHVDQELVVSDLVMSAKVYPEGEWYRYEIGLIYVP